jgi:pyruvate dehydrogenase E1 component beta subunit
MAMMGMKPVVEMMTWNFSFLASDQIIQNAAKVRYFSGGQVEVPLVIAAPTAAASSYPPSTPTPWRTSTATSRPQGRLARDAQRRKGMMITAIRDPNPVIFLEAGALYGTKGEVEEGDNAVEFGKARVAREGSDVTLIAYGRQVNLCLRRPNTSKRRTASPPRSSTCDPSGPFDEETISRSVRRRTGR